MSKNQAAVESLPREHAQTEAFVATKKWSVVPPGARYKAQALVESQIQVPKELEDFYKDVTLTFLLQCVIFVFFFCWGGDGVT